MDQTRRSTLPSKGEVAFRFIACTTVALALYYTPELRWSSSPSDAETVQADAIFQVPVPGASPDACASIEERVPLIDAAVKAN